MSKSAKLEVIWNAVHSFAKAEKYLGYNKHDGLNSPILNAFLGWSYWTRIVAIQGVMRFPINIRPLFFTRKVHNPKGLSLFARSLLFAYEAKEDEGSLEEARVLLNLLIQIRKENGGVAWGYQYPWQDVGFFAPAGTPNAVVTSFVCNAFLHGYKVTRDEKYLHEVESAITFFLSDLRKLHDEEDQLCLSYMPLNMNMRVMDVSILIASVIASYSQLSARKEHLNIADKLVNYVVSRQTDIGAWFYTDPPEQSHIVHDNYHTGFILDALYDYMEASNDYTYLANYKLGLDFYAKYLFEENGAPRWMSHIQYPYDIHGAAQGIITFSRHEAEFPGLAIKIANWAVENMYSGKGYFFYQKNRFFKKKFTLLRWCNAWMCFALSNLLYGFDEKQDRIK